MKITKYQHACVVVEDHDSKVVIDPGDCTPDFGSLEDISAVIVTHVHPDHFFAKHLDKIVDHNPKVKIFTTSEVKKAYDSPCVVAVSNGEEYSLNSLTLHFTGEKHEAVHPDWPVVQNVGVQINDTFYYGGDSFTPPHSAIKVLAVPVSYAWLSVGRAMDFVAAIKPRVCFPTHNYPLSDSGQNTADRWIASMCEKHEIIFEKLNPGESLDVS